MSSGTNPIPTTTLEAAGEEPNVKVQLIQEEMAGFTQDPEDYYQACFQSSPDQVTFPDPQEQYMGMNMTPMPQSEFQQSCVKEETNEQAIGLQNSLEGSTSKKLLKHQTPVEATSAFSLEQVPLSQRRKRTVYSQHQLDVLEEFFQTNMYPDIHHREELAKRIYIPESRIQVWFQNRRGKVRREKSKSSPFNNVGTCYPNILPPVMHLGPAPTQSEQHQPMMPQQQGQTTMNLQQDIFRQPLDSMPYPPYSCSLSRERIMMSQVSPNVYYQNQHANIQQPLYRNTTTDLNDKAVDLSLRPNQMPTQLNFMADFNTIPPNKTITPDMNIKIPAIPMSTQSRGTSRVNPSTVLFRYKMSSIENTICEQRSPDFDSGVSDRSPESESDSKETISSVVCGL
ncbi:homeobox protein Mix.1-like [Rhinoderma darwinii]|uniref:homeobox protein Mix.1-like n=1 Tax=Rhinoderma darwinii TaxID=43563 RepID=UPI003F67E31F